MLLLKFNMFLPIYHNAQLSSGVFRVMLHIFVALPFFQVNFYKVDFEFIEIFLNILVFIDNLNLFYSIQLI